MTNMASVGGADLVWAAATDVGRSRSLNEDSHLVLPPVFLVADGMGGHESGDIASALVVERFRALAEAADGRPAAIEDVVAELHNLNNLLAGASGGSVRGMGTTAVALVVVDNGGTTSWLVANVGDSRAYSWRRDRLNQVTRDHSFVQDLVDAGAIGVDEARSHPQRNLVTRALGIADAVDPDFWVRPVRPGERFLLCSDGLNGELDDKEIADRMAAGAPAAETAECLVHDAVEAGGHDNVTAVVVDVPGTPGAEGEAEDEDEDEEVEVTTGRRPFRRITPPPPPPPDVDDVITDVPLPPPTAAPAAVATPDDPITEVPTVASAATDGEEVDPPDLIASMPADLIAPSDPETSTEDRQ